jgi:predicted AAA+ superfamily ATPase
VGKSTLCDQLIQEGAFKGQAVTLDDPVILAGAQADPMGFLQDLDKHVIIDEVQRVPELLLSIKKLVDEDRTGRRIILTGSANVMVLPKVADSLAGRIEIHNVWPFSLGELQGKKSNFLQNLVAADGRFEGHKISWDEIVQAIKTGGYPEIVKRTRENRRAKWFESYIKLILQKDIKELSNIEGLADMPMILNFITTRVGSTINFSELGRLAKIKNSTMHRYITLLEQVFLILKIPAWTPNAEGEFVKSPKIILNDTGLLYHLRGEGVESLIANRSTAGSFLENFVTMEIIKQISWSDVGLKPYHFSMHKGAEVDLVLEDSEEQLYGIEVKSTATITLDNFKGLKRLAEIAGKKFKRGIVLYTGEHTVGGFGTNMQAVPMGSLWN